MKRTNLIPPYIIYPVSDPARRTPNPEPALLLLSDPARRTPNPEPETLLLPADNRMGSETCLQIEILGVTSKLDPEPYKAAHLPRTQTISDPKP